MFHACATRFDVTENLENKSMFIIPEKKTNLRRPTCAIIFTVLCACVRGRRVAWTSSSLVKLAGSTGSCASLTAWTTSDGRPDGVAPEPCLVKKKLLK